MRIHLADRGLSGASPTALSPCLVVRSTTQAIRWRQSLYSAAANRMRSRLHVLAPTEVLWPVRFLAWTESTHRGATVRVPRAIMTQPLHWYVTCFHCPQTLGRFPSFGRNPVCCWRRIQDALRDKRMGVCIHSVGQLRLQVGHVRAARHSPRKR